MAADDVPPGGRLEGDFGPNVGLVEEIYRQWLEDPASVAESWQDFFADYKPRLPSAGLGNGGVPDSPAVSAPPPAGPAPQAQPQQPPTQTPKPPTQTPAQTPSDGSGAAP